MEIEITKFALRNWDPTSGSSTQVLHMTPADLVRRCNQAVIAGADLVTGYAPFCCHLFIENPTSTRCGFAPITAQNATQLRSGYASRRDGELAVLERWFEGVDAPVAKYLDVILYSHAQLIAEAQDYPEDSPESDVPDCAWGIVSIIGTLEPVEPPMPPITQLRNALGRAEGGSGAAIDSDSYKRAVDFWQKHAAVR